MGGKAQCLSWWETSVVQKISAFSWGAPKQKLSLSDLRASTILAILEPLKANLEGFGHQKWRSWVQLGRAWDQVGGLGSQVGGIWAKAGDLEANLGDLGGQLGGSWGQLGRSWRPSWRSWGQLGSILEPTWEVLVPTWRSWRQLNRILRIVQKPLKTICFYLFFEDRSVMLEPLGGQVGGLEAF